MFSINKNNENSIEDYSVYVISYLLNGYIHLYWTGPLTFASYNGGNIISTLRII